MLCMSPTDHMYCRMLISPHRVEDHSIRYVAEENIQITTPDVVTPSLMAIAGQHFKRWDGTSKVFVSNIRDEYPDD